MADTIRTTTKIVPDPRQSVSRIIGVIEIPAPPPALPIPSVLTAGTTGTVRRAPEVWSYSRLIGAIPEVFSTTILDGVGAIGVTRPNLSAVGTVSIGFAAIGTPSVRPPSLAATGELLYSGSAALSVTTSISATGALIYSGSAALTVTKPTVAATGELLYSGSAALSVTALAVAGVGTFVYSGSAALSVTTPSVAATGALIFPGAEVTIRAIARHFLTVSMRGPPGLVT